MLVIILSTCIGAVLLLIGAILLTVCAYQRRLRSQRLNTHQGAHTIYTAVYCLYTLTIDLLHVYKYTVCLITADSRKQHKPPKFRLKSDRKAIINLVNV